METLPVLQNIWYILVGVLLAGYSVLDGFDLGVGTLLPFLAKKDDEKRALYNSVGPFWDGNEVWLLTGAGALFAAFPHAYATVFSGFYLALMLVLFALIFRAVSLEFGAKVTKGKGFWTWAFVIGSFLPSLLYGVALGNVIVGVPLNEHMDFIGNFFTLLRPFPLVLGLLGLVAILLQGSTYAAMKTEGDVRARAVKATKVLWVLFILLFVFSAVAAAIYVPGAFGSALAWAAALAVLVSWVVLRLVVNAREGGPAFFISSLTFLGLWGIAGAVHWPNIVKATDEGLSLTIYNASSTQLTLTVMLIIAAVGVPIMLVYTALVYRVLRGKVTAAEGIY